MNYYIQHSIRGKENWITHQMAYDERSKAMDVFYAVYKDDKYLDYRVVDERFVTISPTGIVKTDNEHCCENCKHYYTMDHDRMGQINNAPYHCCDCPKQATYPDDIQDYSYEHSNGGKDCPYFEIV